MHACMYKPISAVCFKLIIDTLTLRADSYIETVTKSCVLIYFYGALSIYGSALQVNTNQLSEC